MKGLTSTKSSLLIGENKYLYFDIKKIEGLPSRYWERLPFSIRILLEGIIRNMDHDSITLDDVHYLANWAAHDNERKSVPFFPGRVVLQDFTGVPVMNDLAAMRHAMVKLGGDPLKVNPLVPVDLVIDHSVMVDDYANAGALETNARIEFERNKERYEFFRWCEQAFENFRVVPPATGIVHQVNLEYLSKSVIVDNLNAEMVAYPDTLIGTDSHTTMINGLGVLGWGVGGIEAVAAMMGQPLEIIAPEVIGIKISGRLPEGTTPTDLTLTVIQTLRRRGVVDKFVEFFGDGLDNLTLADRAMIANMTPESGATVIYFPVDQQTLDYLRLTGKSEEQLDLVEAYFKAQSMFRDSDSHTPEFTEVIEVDLSSIEPSLAGPKRPQDRVPLSQLKENFQVSMSKPKNERGFGLDSESIKKKASLILNKHTYELKQGFLAIAAITSCTNTSNPFVMVAAGLLAQNAVKTGLHVPAYVKTSFAPGSRVVTEYLIRSGLMTSLEALGFNLVGYGCTTCIGNSGPLIKEVVDVIQNEKLLASAVLSGNRNFEGRINPYTQANYLASPPLVVAFALAGTIDIDLTREPLGQDQAGKAVFLRDIWPTSDDIMNVLRQSLDAELFQQSYKNVYAGNSDWNAIEINSSPSYTWEENSTYLQEPPFFEHPAQTGNEPRIVDARVLLKLGDSITTDHISPAGSIPLKSPAGQYLVNHTVPLVNFNSYGSRRGNDQVMSRGTFANIRLKNLLLDNVEGGYTKFLPSGEQMDIYDAAVKYQAENIPLIVIAGKEYGTGSSRDWAAKGPLLLGIKAVIAESFERIHRSNLVGMGILPLQFLDGQNAESLGLSGNETYDIDEIVPIQPGKIIPVHAKRADGSTKLFNVKVRIDTPIEVKYFQSGGIMNLILYNLANDGIKEIQK